MANNQCSQILCNLHEYFIKRKNDPSSEEYKNNIDTISLTSVASQTDFNLVTRLIEEIHSKKSVNFIDECSEVSDVILSTSVTGCIQKTSSASCSLRELLRPQNENTKQYKRATKKKDKKKATNEDFRTYSCFTEGSIRRRVLRETVYFKNKLNIYHALQILIDENIWDGGLCEFINLCRRIGFRSTSQLYEHNELIMCRQKYLDALKKYRLEGRPIVYIDETYLTMTESLNWITNEESDGVLHAMEMNKSPGIVIIHAGGRTGFIKGAFLAFQYAVTISKTKQTMSYHLFKHWIQTCLLPNLDPKSVVVMDNAYYHLTPDINMPVWEWSKEDIVEWLNKRNIVFCGKLSKVSLLMLVKLMKFDSDIDNILHDAGHILLRLPPSHQELNPLEMIWRDIKRECIASSVESPKIYLDHVLIELDVLFRNYPLQRWSKCMDYVESLEEEYYNYGGFSNTHEEDVIEIISDDSS